MAFVPKECPELLSRDPSLERRGSHFGCPLLRNAPYPTDVGSFLLPDSPGWVWRLARYPSHPWWLPEAFRSLPEQSRGRWPETQAELPLCPERTA